MTPTDGGIRAASRHGVRDERNAPVIGTDPRVTTPRAKALGTEWELRTFLELGALPTAVPCARLHTRQVLWEWHLDALSDTAELVVSELVTNAVRVSAGLTGSRRAGRWIPGMPPVRLWLSSDRERILIQVWDASDRHPVPQQSEPDAESGRGLLLVESLSADWGSYPADRSSGKVVWALIVPGRETDT
jgi:anti-sigma regulatory factor (Ser/Thr protein kinase)